MKRRYIIIIFSSIMIISLVITGLWVGERNKFTPGDYYDSEILNYMGVVYDDRNDIDGVGEFYSESENCPWNFVHTGLDYFLKNGSIVIASVPGKIIEISVLDNGPSEVNRYMIHLHIQFNETIIVQYCFEPWSQDVTIKDQQLELLTVELGDWVKKGDIIATFISMDDSAHIHYDVMENEEQFCPQKYFGAADYTEIMEMIHSFEPTWNLCYP